MNRKTRRKLLSALSRIPGGYSMLAFIAARRVTVEGMSMAPGILPGDRLLVDRLAYDKAPPAAGEVVLLEDPRVAGRRIVKRLAAVPGESAGGRTLADDEYWVVGDNLGASTDSREFGAVRRRDVLGTVWLRYWPYDRWRVFG